MNQFPFLLARRFFGSITTDKTSARLTLICFASIALGSCALLVTTAVINGFRRVTAEVMQSVHPDITIQSFNKEPLSYQKIKSVLETEFKTTCAFHTPFSTTNVLIQSQQIDDISHLATIEGINPLTDPHVRKLPLIMNKENKSIEHILSNGNIIIGKALADELNLSVGSSISLLYATNFQPRNQSVTFAKETARIGALFKTGLDDVDRSLIICSLDFFDEIFPEIGISHIGIRCAQNTDLKKLAFVLGKRFKLDSYAWHELYPAFNEALALENYALILIIILITTITSLSIASLLSLLFFQKRHTLAILRALGVPQTLITKSFLFLGAIIVVGAQMVGGVCAVALSLLLEKYKIITLPDAYYVSYLPAELNPLTVCIVLAIGTAVGLCISWVTTRRNSSLSVMSALKSE